MSNKAKNLHFEAKQPAFLRRLRGEADSLPADSNRSRNQDLRRTAIKTSADDDDPTYVLEESGSTISKAEYDALVSSRERAPGANETAKDIAAEPAQTQVDKPPTKPVESSGGKTAAAIGLTSKKRKATQVVTEDSRREANTESASKATSRQGSRPKKKPKTIKLSFGEDGET
jgi:hypothetical protein